MSLQAIAGRAYDRQAESHTRRTRTVGVAGKQVKIEEVEQTGRSTPPSAIDRSLETLKRYIPTELLALYIPFTSAVGPKGAPTGGTSPELLATWAIFTALTPIIVVLLYVGKSVQHGKPWKARELPWFEAALGTIAFAAWGASFPNLFPDQQNVIALGALASTFLLPIIENARKSEVGGGDGAG